MNPAAQWGIWPVMIPKYRNRGTILVVSGLGLLILAAGTYGICLQNDFRRLGGCLAVIMLIFGVILYQWGGFTLAKAKGYSADVAGGIIAFGLLCFGLIFFIAPLVVLLLKDKTRHSRMSRPARRPDRKTTILAAWSISLSALAWLALLCVMTIPALHKPTRDFVAQSTQAAISCMILLAPVASAALATIVLRRRGIENTLAVISIGLAAVLLLLLITAVIVGVSKHRSASPIQQRQTLLFSKRGALTLLNIFVTVDPQSSRAVNICAGRTGRLVCSAVPPKSQCDGLNPAGGTKPKQRQSINPQLPQKGSFVNFVAFCKNPLVAPKSDEGGSPQFVKLRSHLTNRSRWRDERFCAATRRDAGRIPAVGFNRGRTTWAGKRSIAPAPIFGTWIHVLARFLPLDAAAGYL